MFEERRPQGFIWVAAAVLVIALGYRLLADRAPEPPPVTVEREGRVDVHGHPRKRTGGRLYVHVAGAVRRPGLYRVREGARAAAAIDLAGGPKPKADLTSVNLAGRVQDGQQLVVPVRGAVLAPAAATPGGPAPDAGGTGAISLATATQPQLEELDGIGPTLAARILEYRDEHGGFRSVEELAEVDGIGEVRLEALRGAVQP